jgi:uncharacterized protein (TIGR03437 family)
LIPAAHAQQELFSQQFALPEFVVAEGVAVDATGVYAISRQEAYIRKFDQDGNILWTRTVDVVDHDWIAIGAAGGRVFVLFRRNMDQKDKVLRAFGPGGQDAWTLPVPFAFAMAVDATGIYVTGGDAARFQRDCFIERYDLNGAQIWTRSLFPFGAYGRGDAIAVDESGVYWAGVGPLSPWDYSFDTPFLEKISRNGESLWLRQESFPIISRMAAGANGVYATSFGSPPTLMRYDGAGNLLWSHAALPGQTELHGLAADSSGVYLAGRTFVALPASCMSGYVDGFVRKLNPTGELLWSRQFSQGHGVDFGLAWDLAADEANLYLAGNLTDSSNHALLARLPKAQEEIRRLGPSIASGCVVNAANFRGGQISPTEIVAILGQNLGPQEGIEGMKSGDGQLTITLGESRVLFDGIAADLLYASATQLNAIVPEAVRGRVLVRVEVERNGVRSNAITMPIANVRPGVFTVDGSGKGALLAINEDGSLNSEQNPAERGSSLKLFVTGLRLSSAVSAYFCCYSDAIHPSPSVIVAAIPGSTPGLFQVTLSVPSDLQVNDLARPRGDVWVQLQVDGEDGVGQNNYVFIRGAYGH